MEDIKEIFISRLEGFFDVVVVVLVWVEGEGGGGQEMNTQ